MNTCIINVLAKQTLQYFFDTHTALLTTLYLLTEQNKSGLLKHYVVMLSTMKFSI